MRAPAEACTFLFVPGSRPERFDRAVSTGADQVVLDLEDAVDAEEKAEARGHVRACLSSGGTGLVRVNANATPWFEADCAAIADLPGLAGVVLPKAEDPASVARLIDLVGPDRPVIALVESAAGILDARRMATVRGVVRLAFGSVDFAADIASDQSRDALLLARSSLVLASRAAGIAPPVDGVTTALDDVSEVLEDARHARSLGFTGKLCIHPRQVDLVAEAFRPTPAEIAWARRVTDSAADGSARRVDGQMVDRPVLDRAVRILADAGRPGEEETA